MQIRTIESKTVPNHQHLLRIHIKYLPKFCHLYQQYAWFNNQFKNTTLFHYHLFLLKKSIHKQVHFHCNLYSRAHKSFKIHLLSLFTFCCVFIYYIFWILSSRALVQRVQIPWLVESFVYKAYGNTGCGVFKRGVQN